MIFIAQGHNDILTDGEARASCATVPEGKTNHALPTNHEVLFLLHVFDDIKIHLQIYEASVYSTSPNVDLFFKSFAIKT